MLLYAYCVCVCVGGGGGGGRDLRLEMGEGEGEGDSEYSLHEMNVMKIIKLAMLKYVDFYKFPPISLSFPTNSTLKPPLSNERI